MGCMEVWRLCGGWLWVVVGAQRRKGEREVERMRETEREKERARGREGCS